MGEVESGKRIGSIVKRKHTTFMPDNLQSNTSERELK